MTPRDYLSYHSTTAPAIPGVPSSPSPVTVRDGETVGVVCLSSGGPSSLDDVHRFLYDQYMDPARLDLGMGGYVRHLFARLMANLRKTVVQDRYEMIGGRSPLLQLAGEQAESLERHLNRSFRGADIDFRSYIAHRHGAPTFEDTAARMKRDGVDRVVLLPLAPHYATARTRAWLRYWDALEQSGDIPSWPRTAIHEYAANPKYVQAISERIDEAMQRFPRTIRPDIHLVFAAAGLPPSERDRRCDPSCCLACSTVDRVMRLRGHDRSFSIAFQPEVGPATTLTPSVQQTVDRLAQQPVPAILIVPVSFVADRVETSVDLDIELRERAFRAGIHGFEVTSGLNTHPLFIEALAEAAVSQCRLPSAVMRQSVQGDGAPTDYPLLPLRNLPKRAPDDAMPACPACNGQVRPRAWGHAPDTTAPQRPTPKARPLHAPAAPSLSDASVSDA